MNWLRLRERGTAKMEMTVAKMKRTTEKTLAMVRET